jgi:hypothetical protein
MTHDIDNLNLLEGQEMRYFSEADSKTLNLAFMQNPVLESFFAQRETLI